MQRDGGREIKAERRFRCSTMLITPIIASNALDGTGRNVTRNPTVWPRL